MDVIRLRQERRANQVKTIQDSIWQALLKKENKSYKETLMAIMVNMNLSKVTATDYLERALFNLGINSVELDKRMQQGLPNGD